MLSIDKYKESISNLPLGFVEYILEGGNHAYFGDYGEQSGDGKANITPDEQIKETTKYIIDFVMH